MTNQREHIKGSTVASPSRHKVMELYFSILALLQAEAAPPSTDVTGVDDKDKKDNDRERKSSKSA